MIASSMIEEGTQAHTKDGRYRRIKERSPVATELNTEATAGKSGRRCYLPIGITALFALYLVQLLLILIKRIIVYNSLPRQFTDGRNGVHIDTVLLTSLEFHVGMVLIAEVHHQHCIVHKDMKMLLGKAQESRRTLHVTQDTGRIGRALNEQSAGFQQQIKFTTQLKIGGSLQFC